VNSLKIRVGIIGIGGIGRAHLYALRQLSQVEVVAVCSRTDMENRAKALNVSKGYTDYKEMIDQEKLDFVHICTTNDTHYDMAKYALEHNVNVVLEKPMTLDQNEAKELRDLAIEKGLIHEVHFHNRFYGANFEARKNIETIGEIYSIHGHYVQDWMFKDLQTNWRLYQKESGKTRVVADIGSHFMDLIEYVSGHKIVEVCAEFKTVYEKRNNIKVDTEDLAAVLFKTNLGALGTCFITQSTAGIGNLLQVTYSGKEGSIEWDDVKQSDYILGRAEGREVININHIDTLDNEEYFTAESSIDAFREAFRQVYQHYQNREFKPAYATFNDGYHSMCLIDAIYESSLKRGWVKVND